MKNALALVSIFLLGCSRRSVTDHPAEPAPTDAPPALTMAHEAYLAGDWIEMGERIEEVLLDPRAGELAKSNAYALLDSAFDATKGHLPARAATLPRGVKAISLGVINGTNPYGTHRMVYLDVRVAEGRGKHVTDMRVVRLPSNDTLLSLSEKRGALIHKSDGEKGFEGVDLELRDVEVLPDRGVFSIRVTFDDGPAIDTFVLATKLVSSAQPDLVSPDVNDVVKGSPSSIEWHPFRSPESAAWEMRSLWLGISREKSGWWDFYQYDPGALSTAPVTKPLDPGSYWVSLTYFEERMFGAVRLQRGSETGRPFSVVR